MVRFFMKLFKALNSSQTPWQMSLALSLGMAMGLTPYSGIQTIVLIFIVLVVNMHVGLFLISSAFFAGIGYLFDPYFEQLGYALLNMEALDGVFTAFYNSALLRLTYFNNTIVLGSNVVAFILVLPMFFILNRVVYIYRDKIASKLQQYTILRKLGISVSDKKDKFFRVWGIGLFLILSVGVVLFSVLFLDALLKNAIEDNLTKILKKKVSIENLDVLLTEGKINIDNLHVADDKKAVVSTKNINIDIDLNQLLFKRYHIENINVSGMAFSKEVKPGLLYTGPSTTSSKVSPQIKEKSSEEGFKLPSLSLEDPKALIARMGLSSLGSFDATKEKISAINTKYKNIIENDFSKDELTKISSEIKDIQERLKSKDISSMLQLKEDVTALNKKIKAKKELLSRTKKEFSQDKNSIQQDYKDLTKGAAKDYNNLKSQYTFDSEGGVNIVGVLFGDKLKTYLGSFLKYYEIAKPYLKSGPKKTEQPIPPRGEGRWVAFKYTIPTVDFLIKSTNISGELQKQDFKLAVKDISSNQKLLKAPMTFLFSSDGDELKGLVAKGEDNHLKEHVKTTSSFSLVQGVLENTDMSFMNLKKAKYSFKGELNAEDYIKLNAQTKVLFSNVSLSLKKTDSKLMKSLAGVVSKIDNFDLDVKLNGSVENPEVSVKSNLDKKLSGVFSSVFENEVKKYQGELKALIDTQVKDKLKELGIEQEGFGDIDKLLNAQSLGLDNMQSSTNGIGDTIKNKAGDELKDKAKSLFKGF
ncbi:TIGR03545 family protein [Candidatus Sulfurimonas marisnigri]|uniref:TIGR03545 family protein n=1 Tax=Candidatus Sulfurimonas marisnigri TaxID=2740405 RepID=A0A7S7M1Q7_9BACT|nr:TIGR03545 family protein [Candidatus Sulfurimonas marisnigri]QOY55420.1 TIGR03545 family protein [Candidatus Sulfurimonas marisnigri]